MRVIKIIVLIIMGILFIATILMITMGAWMPVLGIGAGIIFIYYLIIYVLIKIADKKSNKILNYSIYFLIFVPLIWAVFDAEGVIDNFMSYVLQDFKYQI